MFNFYHKLILKKWFQSTPASLKSCDNFKTTYRPIYTTLLRPIRQYKKKPKNGHIRIKTLIKKIIPKILLKGYFIKKKHTWKQYINIFKKKCPKFLTMQLSRKPYFFRNTNFGLFWQLAIRTKQKTKVDILKESRKLKWLQLFYRNFGFRRNKNRVERPLLRTKKFRKFSEYYQVLKLLRHKKVFRKYVPYQIQSCRLKGPSYYKIHKQLFIYWKKNYLAKNFTRKKIANIAKKTNQLKKEKLISFVSNVELTVNSLLLRMCLLNTTGIAQQFIKHVNVYVNYNKVLSPNYIIKPGDTISIYINAQKQKYHRFHDPLYTSKVMPGLYRKYTGRQSLLINEKSSEFIKTSLNTFNNWKPTQLFFDRPIYSPNSVTRFQSKLQFALFKSKNWQLEKKIQKKRICCVNQKLTAWKLGFLYNKIPSKHIQKNKNIMYLQKTIA